MVTEKLKVKEAAGRLYPPRYLGHGDKNVAAFLLVFFMMIYDVSSTDVMMQVDCNQVYRMFQDTYFSLISVYDARQALFYGVINADLTLCILSTGYKFGKSPFYIIQSLDSSIVGRPKV